MRWLILGVLVVAPASAYAERHSCGGGGNASSSGSSSSSSHGHTSNISYDGAIVSHSESSTVGCIDDTDVVGYRHCTKFGAWGTNLRLPRMFMELGSNVRQFSTGLSDQSGNVSHGVESFTYRVAMPTQTERGRDTAVTTALRVGFGLPAHLYAGAELELGGLVTPATATTEMTSTGSWGAPNLSQSGGFVAGGLAIAGLRGNTRGGAFALEAAGGVRNTSYKFDSSYHDCETSTTVQDTRAVVEARARAEIWLGPWFTAGATLGTNVLSRGDWLAGIYLGLHTRAFAGSR